jgi:hypothetical protein
MFLDHHVARGEISDEARATNTPDNITFLSGRYGVLEPFKSGLERLNVHLRNLMLGIHSAGSLTTREQLVGYYDAKKGAEQTDPLELGAQSIDESGQLH